MATPAALGELLDRSVELTDRLNEVIAFADDPGTQQHADWAWYRLGSINALVRDGGGGPLAASLARGLLEQAAYWDWAVATGVGVDHIAAWAAIEYDRLERLAVEIDDKTWIGWLLPPDTVLSSGGVIGVPANAGDAVRRLGAGLGEPVLRPLQFRGLFAANRLLDVLSHGNVVAAQVLAAGGGTELSPELAAAVLHVATASAGAVVLAFLGPDDETGRAISDLTVDIARAASDVHGLPLGPTARGRRPAKARGGVALHRTSDIQFLPEAAAHMSRLAERFFTAAEAVAVAAVAQRRAPDPETVLAWNSFQMAWANLVVLKGASMGQLGRALLPPAARGLLEDGARWEWLRRQVRSGPSGNALRAIIADSKRYLGAIRTSLLSDGVPSPTFDQLVGPATGLLQVTPGEHRLPLLDEMLTAGHPTRSGIESARPMYSLLSQFVHATPLSVLHLKRDEFASLSAPTYAIAVEAACRGFLAIARTTLVMSCEPSTDLSSALLALETVLAEVIRDAAAWHFLG